MKELNADFIFPEKFWVKGPCHRTEIPYRPLQRHPALKITSCRPLSARLLPPTKPEEEGLIDKSKLLDIKGRSRKTTNCSGKKSSA